MVLSFLYLLTRNKTPVFYFTSIPFSSLIGVYLIWHVGISLTDDMMPSFFIFSVLEPKLLDHFPYLLDLGSSDFISSHRLTFEQRQIFVE